MITPETLLLLTVAVAVASAVYFGFMTFMMNTSNMLSGFLFKVLPFCLLLGNLFVGGKNWGIF